MFTSDSIKTEVVTVTPRLAKQLLDQNTGNRRISPTNLNKVKTSMLRGEWVLNGEAIKISTSGRILDGQHRLLAAIETETTFETLIVYGLPDGTQESMDAGKKRTASDALTIRGYKNTAALSAITTAIIRKEQWGIRAAVAPGTERTVTTAQVVTRVEREPSLTDLPRIVFPLLKVGLSQKLAGLLYYSLSEINPNDTEHFFEKLASGNDLERGNPILTLRNFLLELKSVRGRKNDLYVTAVVIKAWNRYRDGEPMAQARFNPGGAKPEAFPEPK